MTFRPKRCPFLSGEMFRKRFSGKVDSGGDVKFDFRCTQTSILFNSQADIVEEKGCLNEKYIYYCDTYAREVYSKSITIPLICPLIKREGEPEMLKCSLDLDLENCDLATELWVDPRCEEDYRSCELFSKWFWKTAIKEVNIKGGDSRTL